MNPRKRLERRLPQVALVQSTMIFAFFGTSLAASNRRRAETPERYCRNGGLFAMTCQQNKSPYR